VALYDDVDAIHARLDLTVEQKYAQAAALKAAALRDAILGVGVMPQTWNFSYLGTTYSVTITGVVANGSAVIISGTASKPAAQQVLRNIFPVTIINPPLLMPDAAGGVSRRGQSYKFDLIALARAVLQDVIVKG
jgi:hypothetical protein